MAIILTTVGLAVLGSLAWLTLGRALLARRRERQEKLRLMVESIMSNISWEAEEPCHYCQDSYNPLRGACPCDFHENEPVVAPSPPPPSFADSLRERMAELAEEDERSGAQ